MTKRRISPFLLLLALACLPWRDAACAPADTVDVTGQVYVASRGSVRLFYLIENGVLSPMYVINAGKMDCRNGDIVHAIGNPQVSELKATTFVTTLDVLGHKPPPAPPVIDWGRAADGSYDRHPVCVHGVITDVIRDDLDIWWNWIVFNTSSGKGFAAVTESTYPLDRLQRLIDAEVTISGCLSSCAHWRCFLGRCLTLFENGITVTRRPPEDPFASPALGTSAGLHRQRITGHVIGVSRECLFLQTREFGMVSVHTSEQLPQVGSHITAVGFAEGDHNGIQLKNAIFRRESPTLQSLSPAMHVEASDLFTDKTRHFLANYSYYGKIVRLEGQVVNTMPEILSTGRAHVQSGPHMLTVDLSTLRNSLPANFGPGYEISVAGVCAAEFDNNPSKTFPSFGGFTIYPRVPEDLTILRRPPWWTPVRLMVVIGILLAVIVVILVWNRALKVLSERRGRELAREQLHHATSELKVEERTRLAVELHDSISQTLTGVALQIDAAQGSAESPSVAGRFLDTARAMLASCRQELRCCIWDLKSRTFDENDMTEAVTRTLAPHLGDVEAQVRFNVPRSILSESATHDILRIIRELAVNAIRHGQARRLRIAGEYRDGMVRFSVRDDGTGFDPQDVPGPAQGHFGLQGIRERISGRNGEITVESSPDKGTKVTVAFAADERDEDEP